MGDGMDHPDRYILSEYDIEMGQEYKRLLVARRKREETLNTTLQIVTTILFLGLSGILIALVVMGLRALFGG